jgi:Sulfotransferase family
MVMQPDWPAMEDEIATLLSPSPRERNRATLLEKVARYADAVVHEATQRGPASPGHDEFQRAQTWLERPIFICGHHRSGTTLLQQLLDGHPELLVLPSEGTWFSSFHYVARPNPSASDLHRFAADWVARFVDPNFDPHFKLGRSDPLVNPSVRFVQRMLGWQSAFVDARLAPAFSPMLALVAAFRDVTAATTTPCLWAEKTPRNEFHIDRLAVFTHAKFIHVIREPSATLSSLLNLYRKEGIERGDAAEHAWAIAQSIRQARRNQLERSGRYLIVRYEDLTADPYREMERVRGFLEISAHPSLTVPTSVGQRVRSNSSFERGPAGVVHRQSAATPMAIDGRLVAALTAREAKLFGYNVMSLSNADRYVIRLRHLPAHALRLIRRKLRDILRLTR